jgi:hypothetical protein
VHFRDCGGLPDDCNRLDCRTHGEKNIESLLRTQTEEKVNSYEGDAQKSDTAKKIATELIQYTCFNECHGNCGAPGHCFNLSCLVHDVLTLILRDVLTDIEAIKKAIHAAISSRIFDYDIGCCPRSPEPPSEFAGMKILRLHGSSPPGYFPGPPPKNRRTD